MRERERKIEREREREIVCMVVYRREERGVGAYKIL